MEPTAQIPVRVSPPIHSISSANPTVTPFQSQILPREGARSRQRSRERPEISPGRGAEEVKLRREYLYGQVLKEKTQNGERNQKYRYDVEKVPDPQPSPSRQTQLKVSQKVELSQAPSQQRQVENLTVPLSVGGSKAKSILYESSLSRVSPFAESLAFSTRTYSIDYEKDLDSFRKKVVVVNDEIEEGISHLEQMIRELRKKKLEQSMARSKLVSLQESAISQGKYSEPEKTQSIEIISKQSQVTSKAVTSSNVTAFQKSQVLAPIIEEQPASQELSSKVMSSQHEPSQQCSRVSSKGEESVSAIAQSQASLAIEQQPLATSPEQISVAVNKEIVVPQIGAQPVKKVSFPPEYIAFVNRLANQIQLDMDFTNLVITLNKQQQLTTIRELILTQITKFKKEGVLRENFFRVAPQELDPLDSGKPYIKRKWSEDELKEEAFRLYKKYKEIETHFSNKLDRRFSPEVVSMVFEDLVQFNFTKSSMTDSRSVTVGHLLSYLNMRTTKNFRNRYFYKILQRLGLSSSSATITPQVMAQFARQA